MTTTHKHAIQLSDRVCRAIVTETPEQVTFTMSVDPRPLSHADKEAFVAFLFPLVQAYEDDKRPIVYTSEDGSVRYELHTLD